MLKKLNQPNDCPGCRDCHCDKLHPTLPDVPTIFLGSKTALPVELKGIVIKNPTTSRFLNNLRPLQIAFAKELVDELVIVIPAQYLGEIFSGNGAAAVENEQQL